MGNFADKDLINCHKKITRLRSRAFNFSNITSTNKFLFFFYSKKFRNREGCPSPKSRHITKGYGGIYRLSTTGDHM